MGLILVTEVFNLLTHTEEDNLQKAVLIPGAIDDATLQLVPCCYRFKMPRFEEQNVNIYILKSPCGHQSFQQKSLDGHSSSAVSIA